jgi:hypothetical protein
MEKTSRATSALKDRRRAKVDQGLAKQNLTPTRFHEVVRSAISDGISAEKDATRHPMFWQKDEF